MNDPTFTSKRAHRRKFTQNSSHVKCALLYFKNTNQSWSGLRKTHCLNIQNFFWLWQSNDFHRMPEIPFQNNTHWVIRSFKWARQPKPARYHCQRRTHWHFGSRYKVYLGFTSLSIGLLRKTSSNLSRPVACCSLKNDAMSFGRVITLTPYWVPLLWANVGRLTLDTGAHFVNTLIWKRSGHTLPGQFALDEHFSRKKLQILQENYTPPPLFRP